MVPPIDGKMTAVPISVDCANVEDKAASVRVDARSKRITAVAFWIFLLKFDFSYRNSSSFNFTGDGI